MSDDDFTNEDGDGMNTNVPGMSSSWVPDDALKALVTERTLHDDESEEMLARRLLRENLPTAVLGIIHTAQHGESSRIRLDAQKYITERVLGRVGDDAYGADTSPVEAFMKMFAGQVEEHANSGAGTASPEKSHE